MIHYFQPSDNYLDYMIQNTDQIAFCVVLEDVSWVIGFESADHERTFSTSSRVKLLGCLVVIV
jgi:hypothetical protein